MDVGNISEELKGKINSIVFENLKFPLRGLGTNVIVTNMSGHL